jgi:hypothetical protein
MSSAGLIRTRIVTPSPCLAELVDFWEPRNSPPHSMAIKSSSYGCQHRHRLNRGGNRDANRALWVIAIVRMASDPATQAYVQRRTQQGLSKNEIVRCLKRYIARQLYRLLTASIEAPIGASTTP